MKHFIFAILILASALLLAACSPMSGMKDDSKDTLPGDGILDDSTLGDRDGDGHVEDNGSSDGMNAGSDPAEDTGAFTTVKKVKDADDAVNFIGANVYSLCRDSLPVMTQTRVLSNDDMDALIRHLSAKSAKPSVYLRLPVSIITCTNCRACILFSVIPPSPVLWNSPRKLPGEIKQLFLFLWSAM